MTLVDPRSGNAPDRIDIRHCGAAQSRGHNPYGAVHLELELDLFDVVGGGRAQLERLALERPQRHALIRL